MALPGFAKYFRKAAEEEEEHAEELMKFQTQRGGRIKLDNIKKPVKEEWGSGLEAMQAALELEKFMNLTLLDLHKIATKHSDFQVSCNMLQLVQRFTMWPGMYTIILMSCHGHLYDSVVCGLPCYTMVVA